VESVKNHFPVLRCAGKLPPVRDSHVEISRYVPRVPLLHRFLDPSFVSLKICGVTTRADALRLAEMGVDALGVNFWPHSKRYLAPADAGWLRYMAGKILRVGVFVNEPSSLAIQLYQDGLLDAIQLHGDELPEHAMPLREAGIPFLKAIGVKTAAELAHATQYAACGILLDAHAPGIYGGTGEAFDWDVARDFGATNPELPVILAGGLTPDNTARAIKIVRPVAVDIASGAESSPGVKDFLKVAAFLTQLGR
jgi:phosphoribosylanthranilate isomerase